ncbi:hypothetical protein HDU82_004278 [Entophlyctis luteolus]|nr:hypothetical protein HDU82_004278 [Entophlyctis luteolus]
MSADGKDAKDAQDALFFACETEFQTTIEAIAGVPDLDRRVASVFRVEYEKMHKAVLRSRHHAMVVVRQREELEQEYRANCVTLEDSAKIIASDQATIKLLKQQISSAEAVIDANNKNEENLSEELRQLRLDISSLSAQLKQGVGLSVAQERTLNELIATKDSLNKELEVEFDKIVALRNSTTEVTEKIREAEQRKNESERQIYELKDRNTTKKAEIDAETRTKERLERDLRELRIVVAVKSQDVRIKQDSVNRASDDLSILESQVKTQKQMLEKLSKVREGLQSRAAKLHTDCGEQISLSNSLVDGNNELAKELKYREIKLHKNNVEVKKVNKMRDALLKKNRGLEDQRTEVELERKTLRAENEAKLIEIEKTKRAIDFAKKGVDDLCRENEILQTSIHRTADDTAKFVDAALLLRQTRHNIEVDLARENKEIANQLQVIKNLERERDQNIEEAADLQLCCVQGMQNIKQKEMEIFELKKKMIQSETKLKHKQNLYEAVQSDRNLHAKHLIESQSEIADMKRKLKIMNYQINGYKEDINTKYDALAKEEIENSKLAKDIDIISEEVKTLKNQNELAQSYLRSQLGEEMKLNQFVKEADLERTRQENALQVLISERDNLSAQLIRQNEELAKAYNKIKTHQSSLIRSETHYNEKLKEIQNLRLELIKTKKQVQDLDEQSADLKQNKKLARKLTNDITRERARIKALQDQLENPINVHRWRKLEGSNPKAYEMVQLLHTLQKNLITKTKETQDKEDLIGQKEQLYLHLRNVLAKQVGPEALEQVDEFQKTLKEKQLQLKHMDIELNMYHAQVREYKHGLEMLNASFRQLKDDYFELKKKGKISQAPRKLSLPPISPVQNSVVAVSVENSVHDSQTTPNQNPLHEFDNNSDLNGLDQGTVEILDILDEPSVLIS